MANRLSAESSPYLLQHAQNPVDWSPWDAEALARARDLDRPIFLSIGYASCHWCHVMAHESFEDPAIAALLNEHFVPIKVDREQRPDLDTLYMDAVTALTGQGGWPLSVFLTPEGKPFYGGTYFPPTPRQGLPSFGEVLTTVARAWRETRERVSSTADELTAHVASSPALQTPETTLNASVLDRAAEGLLRTYDWTCGGWGGAPKFPQAMAIELLLRRHSRTGDRLALDMAVHALRSMASGGIYDHLAGGFHRYATDRQWRIPHFEKMLYDNALLSQTYLHAWQVTRDPRFREIAEETIDYLLRETRHPEGGIYSALDADSDGEEGQYYLWTVEEVTRELGPLGLADLFITAFGLTPHGNLNGRNVLYRALGDAALAGQLGLQEADAAQGLGQARRALREARQSRRGPAADDKILTVWNGLALAAISDAARSLSRDDYLHAAQDLAQFLLNRLISDGRLHRSWRAGRAHPRGFLDDHAALGLGLLALYQTDFDPRWFTSAVHMAEAILAHFPDPAGGFFDTSTDHETLIARPKTLQNHATPSGNAMAVELFLHLWALTEDERYLQAAEAPLRAIQDDAARHPTAFAAWLCALEVALGPQSQLALAGSPAEPAVQAFLDVVWREFRPRLVVAVGSQDAPEGPPLLRQRERLHGEATAYLCQTFVCKAPTTSPAALERQLKEAPIRGK